MFDTYRDEREIMNMLEDDYENSIIAAEETQNNITALNEEIQEANDYIQELEKSSVDVNGLIEFLSDRNLLTDTLKNEIEYYKKFMEVY
jgi:predicted  nucleic acid-binding Zn-ribbon protein